MTFTSCLRSRWMDGWKAGKSHSRNLVILSFQLQKYQWGIRVNWRRTVCRSPLIPVSSPSLPPLSNRYKIRRAEDNPIRNEAREETLRNTLEDGKAQLGGHRFLFSVSMQLWQSACIQMGIPRHSKSGNNGCSFAFELAYISK